MSARIDGWHRTGATAMSRGKWIIAKVRKDSVWSYEVWNEKHKSQLAFFDSFEKARKYVDELEQKNGLV